VLENDVSHQAGRGLPVVCWSGICRVGSIHIGSLGPINTLSFDHNGGQYSITTLPPKQKDSRYAAVRQYSLAQILAVWAAAAIPMAVLGWVIAPLLSALLGGDDEAFIKGLDLLLRSKGQSGLTLDPPEDERDTPEPADPSDPLPTSAAQIAAVIATDTPRTSRTRVGTPLLVGRFANRSTRHCPDVVCIEQTRRVS